jgi:hypothetical protein
LDFNFQAFKSTWFFLQLTSCRVTWKTLRGLRMKDLLFINLAATLFLTGVIWVVQLVHYPLMSLVGQRYFPEYHAEHSRRITRVVLPPMVTELATALALLKWPPANASFPMLLTAAMFTVVIWISTFLIQVPQHEVLGGGFQAVGHRRLVLGNWIRTIAWTARSALLLCIVLR